MQKIYSILLYLENKKAIIAAIIGLIISYLVTDHTISATFGTLLQSILAILTGGAVAVTATPTYQAILGATKK